MQIFLSSKTSLERSFYRQSQVYLCLFSENSFILTYVDECVIVSHKQETITSLIESLNIVAVKYLLTDEGDISNYLGVNIKKNSFGTL